MVDQEPPEIHRKPLLIKLEQEIADFRRVKFVIRLKTGVISGRIRPDIADRMVEEFDYLQPLRVFGLWRINPFWRKAKYAPHHLQR